MTTAAGIARRRVAFVLAAASALTLLGAFYFQYVEGLRPCPLCLDQRWAHGAGIALALAAAFTGGIVQHALLGLAGAAFLTGAIIAGFHVGVEFRWWAGLDSCTGGSTAGLSAEELAELLLATPPARCDEVPWSLLGVSMAGWNGAISAALGGIALVAAARGARG
ncbi:MAG: disulfide bond formation protein B [Alphaproteobacteria bacterium]|nr:disulfide bond formation protein B [Alphaproteobacteria bacterium]